MMNIHGLKRKLKHINVGLKQHYKKKYLLIQTIEQLEITKRSTKDEIQRLTKIKSKKKGK